MDKNLPAGEITVGVVGLGLMGSSIIVSLLIAGHPVKAIAPLPQDMQTGPGHINEHIHHCYKAGLLSQPVDAYLSRLSLSEDYSELNDCSFVLECVTEILDIKAKVYAKIEEQVNSRVIIASNTSAIAISKLQHFVRHPERLLGVHWSEPAYMSRFLEITCGAQTAISNANWVYALAEDWGKEPTLLKKDLSGFITNRLMYAVYREALALVEAGDTTLEDVDKAFRYDAGSWMTTMGVFRRMDYTGLQDYPEIFRNVFQKLSNRDELPALMQHLVAVKARGIQSESGFYTYAEGEGKEWEQAFSAFNKEIFELAANYSSVTVHHNKSTIADVSI